MPAKDLFHEAVVTALQKDGWIITHDPLYLRVGKEDSYIDLGAERIIAAEKDNEKIAVEIKSFSQPSLIYAFHEALGQFLNYLIALKKAKEDRNLFLAVTEEAYLRLQRNDLASLSIEEYGVNILVFNESQSSIVKWIQ